MEISIHEVRIVKAGPERIVDVEPLWKALHMYYQDIDSGLPFRSRKSRQQNTKTEGEWSFVLSSGRI